MTIIPTTAQRLLGGNQGGRKENDFYATPSWAVESLLQVEKFPDLIWEPACGDGAISKVLRTHGHEVLSTDLIDRGYGQGGIDFTQVGGIMQMSSEPT